MIEEFGDIWEMKGDAIAITTNGAVRKDGACVMGRGIAAQAKERYPGIEFALGDEIRTKGNHVHRLISEEGDVLYSFPVKHHWGQPADLYLIRRSAQELSKLATEGIWSSTLRVLVPRPGCGNGQRSWEEVEPILRPILDDRFVVVTYE